MSNGMQFVAICVLIPAVLAACTCPPPCSNSLVDLIPPEAATETSIGETAARIHIYMMDNSLTVY